MLPYWLFFGVFALGALIARPDLRPGKQQSLLLFGLPLLIVMVGLRDWVGVDFANYLKAWNAAAHMSLERFLNFRPGDTVFYTILWVMRNFNWPYWSFNLLCAIVFSVGLVQFARKQPNAWLAVAVAVPYLVIVIGMSGVRQATAIGIVFLALISFKRGSALGFVLWTLTAALFHASAIVVLPFVGLSLARNRFQSAMLLLAVAGLAYFTFGETFSSYSRDYMTRYTSESSGTAYRIAMNVLPALIYLLLSKRLPFSERERTVWRNFSLLALASVPLLFVVQSTTALDRLLLYAYPLQVMLLAWLPYLFRGRVQQTGITMAILAYLALQQFVFLNYATNAHRYVPYRNVIFSE